jgi:putative DNA primase/helicase
VTAAAIAAALGGASRSGDWWRCLCPAHSSRGATLALRDGGRGLIVKCWAGCDPRDVLAELRRLGLVDGGAEANPNPVETARRHEVEMYDRQRRIALAQDIVAASLPACGTPVERYLRARGITILPPAIRYLPMGDPYARHRSGSRRPVMVVAVQHVEHGIVGAHRTWLAVDGSAKQVLIRYASRPARSAAARCGLRRRQRCCSSARASKPPLRH